MRVAPWVVASTVLFAGTLQPAGAAPGSTSTKIPQAALQAATQLREQALHSPLGFQIVESLTTQVGPRMAGSAGDARAVEWAQAKFKALGYDKVWLEEVRFPKWERRGEHAAILGTHAQPLTVAALGGSPGGTVEAPVVRFADLAALEAAPAGSLAGKIAFVDHPMERARDGAGYGAASKIRSRGPSAAIRAGAAAYLMRPAGTDSHRNAHTGITRFDAGLTPIPSASLSNPDADQLARLLAQGPVSVRVALDCGWNGEAVSYNVIGDIRGARKPNEVVLIGGHLDSWDQGTGAIDDGAGVGLTMAAGALIGQMKKRPARTIRVVAFANEEQGLYGGKAYAAQHADEIARHVIAAESDFGAGRVYAFRSGAPERAQGAVAQIAQALAPLGIVHSPEEGGPGPDISPFAERGLAWAALRQDGSDYFDYHHTPDDTLDKVDPQALAQNVAAYAVFAYLAASAEGDFGSEAKAVTPPSE